MIELFITGVVIGILVSCPMGPIGMLCIQRTLSKGQLSGFCSGIGAAFSDLFYAAGTCLFMGLLVNFVEAHERPLQMFGSIIILLFGYYIFRNDPTKNLKPNHELKQTHVQDFVTAFLLTFSNMLVVILLIGLFAQFGFVLPEHSIQMTISGLAGIFVGAVFWWFFITFAVSLMRHWFNIRGIKLFNKLMGIVIMSLAVIGFVASVWFM
jgi:threonine/homoserine/homoserine lactone efflux protein